MSTTTGFRRSVSAALVCALVASVLVLVPAVPSVAAGPTASDLKLDIFPYQEFQTPVGITDDGTVIGIDVVSGVGTVPARMAVNGSAQQVSGLPTNGYRQVVNVHSDGSFLYRDGVDFYGVSAGGTTGPYVDAGADGVSNVFWMNKENQAVGGKYQRPVVWSGFAQPAIVQSGYDTIIAIDDDGGIVHQEDSAVTNSRSGNYDHLFSIYQVKDVGAGGSVLLSNSLERPGSSTSLPFYAAALNGNDQIVGTQYRTSRRRLAAVRDAAPRRWSSSSTSPTSSPASRWVAR